MYAGLEAMKALNLEVLSQINCVTSQDAGRGMIHADAAASIMFCANMQILSLMKRSNSWGFRLYLGIRNKQAI